jgi:hypothetical protein
MKRALFPLVCFAALLFVRPASAAVASCSTPTDAISCIGALDSPEDIFTESFTLASSSTITVQTYGFGGGINAAGETVSPGGFDPLVALFSGLPTSATILTDSSGNPLADADNFFPTSLFSPGCPPAGLVTVGTVGGNCGDDTLTATLMAGTYTLLLTDADFVPLAVNPDTFAGPYDLPDTSSSAYGSSTDTGAYTDLTFGTFQTCVTWTDCNTDTASFAVDITGPSGAPPGTVPEPGSLSLLVCAVVSFALAAARKPSRRRCLRG